MCGAHVRRTCAMTVYAEHARCFQYVWNNAHVRRTCAMNVYTMIHVRRTPVRRTCTAYMYHSVNTLLIVFNHRRLKDWKGSELPRSGPFCLCRTLLAMSCKLHCTTLRRMMLRVTVALHCKLKGCLYYDTWYMIHDTCTAYMCAAHVRRTCAMNVYTMIHVRRTCTAYMYHSVNTLLL